MIAYPTYGSSFDFSFVGNTLQCGEGYFHSIPYGANSLIMHASLVYDTMPTSGAATFYSSITGMNGTSYFSCGTTLNRIYKDVPFFYEDSSFQFVNQNTFSASINARTDQSSQMLNWKGCYVNNVGIPQITVGQTYTKGDIMIGRNTTGTSPYHMYHYRWATSDFSVTADNIIDDASSYTSNDYSFDLLYPIEVMVTPKVVVNEMKNSFWTRHAHGLNALVWEPLQIAFNGLTDAKTKALLLFLETRAGVNRINISLPDPYNKITKYIAQQWSHTMVAYDINSVSIVLIPEPRSYYTG